MTGILVLNKEAGMTSFDVVAIVRKYLHIKKVGHTGTLDPGATGVLPICIGRATRVCDLLLDADKRYRARVALGAQTDTGDADGEVVKRSERRASKEDVCAVLPQFTGEIWQTPPMYSAVKVGGRKLYELARRGVEVEREKRPVRIDSLNLLDFDEQEQSFTLEVACSKGTYIRSLCEDIGQALGTLAHITALERTQSGPFSIEDALPIAAFRSLAQEGSIAEHLLAVDRVFQHLPSLTADAEQERRLRNGNALLGYKLRGTARAGQDYRVYNEAGEFLAVYRGAYDETYGVVVLSCVKSFFEV